MYEVIRKSYPDPFWKSSTSFAFLKLSKASFTKHAWHSGEFLCCRSRCNSYPQFPRSTLGTPWTLTPFCGLKTKENKTVCRNDIYPYRARTGWVPYRAMKKYTLSFSLLKIRPCLEQGVKKLCTLFRRGAKSHILSSERVSPKYLYVLLFCIGPCVIKFSQFSHLHVASEAFQPVSSVRQNSRNIARY